VSRTVQETGEMQVNDPHTSRAPLTCRLLADPAAFEQLRPWWDPLLAASDEFTPWQSLDYVRHWWTHMAQGKELRVFVVERAGTPCLILPLQVSTRFQMLGLPVRMLEPIGMIMYVNRPRLALGPPDPAAYRCALEHLLNLRQDWHLIRIDEKPLDDPEVALLRNFAREKGLLYRDIFSHVCPYLNLRQPWPSYLQSRSSKMRKNLRAARRRLEQIGRVWTRSFESPAEIDEACEIVLRLHRRSWKRWRRIEHGHSRGYQQFFRAWLTTMANRARARVLVLFCGDRPVAATVAIMNRGTYYSAQIVHDRAFAMCSPGTLLESIELEELMTKQKYETYDFLGAFLRNKLRWTSTARPTALVFVMQQRWRNRVIDAYYFHAKPRIKQWLRRLFNRGAPPNPIHTS
jgi:CelD/BcsL family acetyltransferase involved in cellulose biosynthesis